jgi:hypothetical protein
MTGSAAFAVADDQGVPILVALKERGSNAEAYVG